MAKGNKTGKKDTSGPTESQKRQLAAYIGSPDKNITEICKIANVSRTAMYNTLSRPFAKDAKISRARKQQSVGQTTMSDIKKLGEMLSDHIAALSAESTKGFDVGEVGALYKLMIDGATRLKDSGLEDEFADLIDDADLEEASEMLREAFRLGATQGSSEHAEDHMVLAFVNSGGTSLELSEDVSEGTGDIIDVEVGV